MYVQYNVLVLVSLCLYVFAVIPMYSHIFAVIRMYSVTTIRMHYVFVYIGQFCMYVFVFVFVCTDVIRR